MAQNVIIMHTTTQDFSARFTRRLLVAPTFKTVFKGEGLASSTAPRNF